MYVQDKLREESLPEKEPASSLELVLSLSKVRMSGYLE
jgi:hypothetical protein